ncbi:MAG: single-stranded-DNA-specific exonuclease RecJ [Lachnospiraceae bacterium]|nr:single-stranded-DNA-specific exonuclease RecJ [Lachnospiraceae bacterium]
MKKGDFRAIAAAEGVDPLIGRLMVNRGVTTPEEARVYLRGTAADLNDPHLLKDADTAADLILAALDAGEKIAVASDYDDDGIFSGYVLREAIRSLGGEAEIFTPDRVQEGYGLNERIVREAVGRGCSLLLTCDNGIAAGAAVDLAREIGMTVVVTDHHEVPFVIREGGTREEIRVNAHAVVDPKQADCPYPFDGLCGAGVALQLIRILCEKRGLPDSVWENLLPFVAIATVADVMDLTSDNRILVREGLARLEKTDHRGMRALLSLRGLDDMKLTAYHVGFVIGPCFNAAGRIESVREAFDLLDAPDAASAVDAAARLIEINEERKRMTLEGAEQAAGIIAARGDVTEPVVSLILEDVHESLVGLIAGRLRERLDRPVFVFARTAEGLKGSGRSVEAYHMFDHLTQVKDLLQRFGGHAMAAGLSLAEENYPEFVRRINETCGLTEEDLRPVVRIDAAMPADYVTEELVDQMQLLEPCGKGNRSPLFAERHFTLRGVRRVGRELSTAKLSLQCPGGAAVTGVLFSRAEAFCAFLREEYGEAAADAALEGRGDIDVALTYVPQKNEFRGRTSVELVIRNYCRIAGK